MSEKPTSDVMTVPWAAACLISTGASPLVKQLMNGVGVTA